MSLCRHRKYNFSFRSSKQIVRGCFSLISSGIYQSPISKRLNHFSSFHHLSARFRTFQWDRAVSLPLRSSQRSWFSQRSLGPVTDWTPTSVVWLDRQRAPHPPWLCRTLIFVLSLCCVTALHHHNHHYQWRVHESWQHWRSSQKQHLLVKGEKCWETFWPQRTFSQATVCYLSKHDKEQRKHRGWRRERQLQLGNHEENDVVSWARRLRKYRISFFLALKTKH